MTKSVGIIMGSKSDLPVMEGAQRVLQELGVECEMTVVSPTAPPTGWWTMHAARPTVVLV